MPSVRRDAWAARPGTTRRNVSAPGVGGYEIERGRLGDDAGVGRPAAGEGAVGAEAAVLLSQNGRHEDVAPELYTRSADALRGPEGGDEPGLHVATAAPEQAASDDARFERIGGPVPQVAWWDDVDVTVEHQRRRIARAGSPSREPADEPPGLVPIDLDAGEVGPGSDLVERDLPVVDIESVVGEDPGDGRDRLVLGVSAADARDLDEIGPGLRTSNRRGSRPRRARAGKRRPCGEPSWVASADVLRIVLPKGSLEKATLELFEAADLNVMRSSSVDYKATIDDPRVTDVRILRPQEIPVYVAEGLFDVGITGRDWVEETSSDVVSLGELRYSKETSNPVRVVVAVAGDSEVERVEQLPQGVRVSSEYPSLTRRFFESKGIEADVRLSYGASEAKIPDIADCVVDITETGRALRAAGLRIIDTILTSWTEAIANPTSHADPDKRHAMGQLMMLLNGALEARGKVLVKLNVSADQYEAVLSVLPSAKSPTVAHLANGGYAIESVVEKAQINRIIPALRDAGATDLLEIPISKIIH